MEVPEGGEPASRTRSVRLPPDSFLFRLPLLVSVFFLGLRVADRSADFRAADAPFSEPLTSVFSVTHRRLRHRRLRRRRMRGEGLRAC